MSIPHACIKFSVALALISVVCSRLLLRTVSETKPDNITKESPPLWRPGRRIRRIRSLLRHPNQAARRKKSRLRIPSQTTCEKKSQP
jgi:hypothetical protein